MKHNLKRLTALVLALSMCLSLLSATAWAADASEEYEEVVSAAAEEEAAVSAQDVTASGTCGDDLTWELDEDGTLTISGTGPMDDWTNGNIDTRAPWWSEYSGSIVTVIIGDNVTSIGDYAFKDCINLTSIVMPDSITSIGHSAFYFCSSLTDISIPDSVTSIGYSAFTFCYDLTEIVIPDGVTSIDNQTFYYCEGLTSVTIPDSVISIGYDAFYNCTSLKEVTIPDSVTSIGYDAFYNCTSLTSINIPDGVVSIEDDTFNSCSSLRSITIPDSVTSIGFGAFCGCSSLTSVVIPDSVTSIGELAFSDCDSLTSITVDSGNGYYASVDGVLFTKDMETLITYPGGKEGDYSVPDGVISISEYAFDGCENLTSVTIPDSVTTIGGHAFSYCSGLTSVTIGSGALSIGSSSFSSCTNLTYVTIGQGVTSIGRAAFNNCPKLTDVYYAGSEEDWAAIDIALYYNGDLTSATIHYNSTGPDDEDTTHIVSLSPSNGSTDVELATYYTKNDSMGLTVEIEFDQAVSLGEGNFYLCDYETDEVYRTMAADGGDYDDYIITVSDDSKTVSIEIINLVTYCLEIAYADSPKVCIPYDTKLYIKMDSNAVVLTDSQSETCQISDKDTWSFTTEWGLTADQDLFQFLNSETYFDCEHYDVSGLIRSMLLYYALDDKSQMVKLEEEMDENEWSGSCIGIDSVTALSCTGNLDLSKWVLGSEETSAENIADALAPKDSKWTFGTQDLVNYYQLLEIVMGLDANKNKAFKNVIADFVTGGTDWEEMIDEIVALAQNLEVSKAPFRLGITIDGHYDTEKEKNTGTNVLHSVLVTGYREEDGDKILEVYDSSSVQLYGEIIIDDDYNVTINSDTWYLMKNNNHENPNITAINYCTTSDLSGYNIDSLVAASSYETDSVDQVSSLSADEDYTTLYCTGSSDFTITNAEGETFSCTDGEFSGNMSIYDVSTIGEGTGFEYVIQTDSSASFSFTSESDEEVSLSVYQDGCYIDTYAETGADTITIITGVSVAIEGNGTIPYRTHFSLTDSDGMIAILGVSEGDVTFTIVDDEEIDIDSDSLTDTTVRTYDSEGDYTETTMDDSEEGLVIEIASSHSHSYAYADNGDGTHTATCIENDDSYTEAHTYENEVCTLCGAEQTDLTTCTLILSTTTYTYDGTAKTPTVTVTDAEGNTLTEGTDYTVSYSDNTAVGTATVTVTGIGSYSGTTTATFTIEEAAQEPSGDTGDTSGDTGDTSGDQSGTEEQTAPTATRITSAINRAKGIKLTWNAVDDATSYQVYRKIGSGSWKKVKTTSATTWLDTAAMKNGTKYQYKVYAVNDSGKSSASATKTIYRLTAKHFTRAKNVKGKKISLKWTRNTKATGYVIQYSTSKSFTGSTTKTVKIKGNKNLTTTLKNLKKGKTYYIRMRAYKTSGSVTSYAGWSKVKTVKVKK